MLPPTAQASPEESFVVLGAATPATRPATSRIQHELVHGPEAPSVYLRQVRRTRVPCLLRVTTASAPSGP